MDKLTLFLAVFASVMATLNALDLAALRRKLRNTPAPDTEGLAVTTAVPDPWTDAIRTWLDTAPQVPLTPDAILAGALPGTPSTRAASARITTVMKALGYRATRVRLPDQETLTRVFQLVPGAVVDVQP